MDGWLFNKLQSYSRKYRLRTMLQTMKKEKIRYKAISKKQELYLSIIFIIIGIGFIIYSILLKIRILDIIFWSIMILYGLSRIYKYCKNKSGGCIYD